MTNSLEDIVTEHPNLEEIFASNWWHYEFPVSSETSVKLSQGIERALQSYLELNTLEERKESHLIDVLGFGDQYSDSVLRSSAFKFSDGHFGLLVKDGGITFASDNDEMIFPFMNLCYVYVVNIEDVNSDHSKIAWHMGPFENLTVPFLQEVEKRYKVGSFTILGNDDRHDIKVADLADYIAEKTGISGIGIDLSASNNGNVPEVLITNNTAVQCFPFWAKSADALKDGLEKATKISLT